MRLQLLVAATALAGLGCIRPDAANPPPPVSAGSTVDIRIANATNLDFDSVLVRFPNQTTHFGAVPVGAATDYQPVNGAYAYAYVEARAAEKLYVVQPIDFVGESLLPPGRYTYRLEGRFAAAPAAGAAKDVQGFMSIELIVDGRGT